MSLFPYFCFIGDHIMKRCYHFFALFFWMFAFSISVPAQDLPALAPDATVATGALENGITFYVVTNPSQSGHADFALVRKGSADTLSARKHLSSLPHFNKSTPCKFLSRKQIGLRKEGFMVYDEGSTVFRFDNVPVYDQAASDTTLLLLFDLIAAQPSPYAIVVAGDVAAPAIQEKMKTFALMVPSRTPSYTKPEYSFIQGESFDFNFIPESDDSGLSTVTVDVRAPRAQDAQMGTIVPFMSELFCKELSLIVRDRIRAVLLERGVPIRKLDITYKGSGSNIGDEHFIVSLGVDDEHLIQASMTVATSLAELSTRGVNSNEYMAARHVVYHDMLQPQTNDDLVRMCISNYFTGSDLAKPSTKIAFFTSRTMDFNSEYLLFSNYVTALLHDTGSMSVRWATGDSTYDEWTCSATFSSAWKTVSLLPSSTVRAGSVVRDTVNLWSDKGKAKLKSVSTEAVTGSEIWNFSNDVKVLYKKDQSKKNEFSYSLMIRGGYGSIKDLKPGEGAFFTDIFALSDVAGMRAADFARLMKMCGVSMKFEVNATDMKISGSAPSGRLPLVLRALLSIANERSVSRSSYNAYRSVMASYLGNDKVDSLMYSKNPYTSVKCPWGLTDHAFESATEFLDNQFLRVNDGMLVLIGDLPYDKTQRTLSSMVGGFRISKYISQKPSSSLKFSPERKTVVEQGKDKKLEIGLAAPVKFSPENSVAFEIASMILSSRLAGYMAEIGYSVNCTGRFSYFPQDAVETKIVMRKCPEHGLPEGIGSEVSSEELLIVARDALNKALSQQVSAPELAACKQTISNSVATAMADKEQYISTLLMRYTCGKDMLTGFAAKVNAVSADSVKQIFNALLTGTRIEYAVE